MKENVLAFTYNANHSSTNLFLGGRKMYMFHFKSIKTQLITIIVGVSASTTLCIGGFFIHNSIIGNEAQLQNYRQDLEQSIESKLVGETEMAVSTIQQSYEKQQAGLLTEEQAKKEAADRVRALRYDNGKGYFWIDTDEGINVVLLGRDTEGKSRIDSVAPNGQYFIKDMIANGKKDGGGFTDLMFAKPNETTPLPKRNYTVSFAPYHWVLGTGVWIDEIDQMVAQREAVLDEQLHNSTIKAIGSLIVLLALFVLFAIYIGNTIAKPIQTVTDHLKVMGTGDFRQEESAASQMETVSNRRDELGTMAKAMQEMNAKIRGLMQRIVESAEYVAAASEELTSTADQSAQVSNSIADSVVNVAGACSEQFTDVETANTNTQTLASHMEHFTDALTASDQKIQETNHVAETGRNNVEDAVQHMQKIETSVHNISKIIENLGGQSEQIGSIVDTISAIADQTNLLALNAAIEAARAGEQGRGFSVVADEVRKLAEQSQTAASKIATLIVDVQEETQNAVQAMDNGVKEVAVGTETVQMAGQSFQGIAGMVKDIASHAQGMQAIVSDLTGGISNISTAVDKINKKSRAVSDEAQTVSAATEEQTASMQEIADASRHLAEQAQSLQNAIVEFKI